MSAPTDEEPLRSSRASRWCSLAALLAPFLLLDWLVPIGSGLRIGMDYPRISLPQQQELLFSLVHGSFPLFVPGFAGGQGSGALTAGQLYHPITYVAAGLPGYWSGSAQDVMTLLRLVSLGLANLALYRLVRPLVRSELVALLLASATVFNLRMLNVFHGAAALEAFTGHLLSVAALGWCWLRPARLLPRLCLVASVYGTVVSGHPQFAYFSLIGTALAVWIVPGLVELGLGRPAPSWVELLAFWARTGLLVGVGLALAAAYALPFQLDFMASNMRVGREYEFSLWWNDTLPGVVNNFFRPLRTAASVAFGGSSLLLPAALAPLLALLGVHFARVFWAAWAALLVVVLHALGDLTPVHWVFWKFVPLFGSVRGPGRLTVVVPFLAMAILVGVLRARPARKGPLAGRDPMASLCLLALAALLLHALLPAAWTAAAMDNAPVNFTEVLTSAARRAEVAAAERGMLVAGALGLAALAVWASRRGRAGARSTAALWSLVALGAFGWQTRAALAHGTWTEARLPSPTLEELRAEKRERLAFTANPGGGLYSATILARLEHSCLDPFLARLYGKELAAADEAEAYRLMDAGRPRDAAIVVRSGTVSTQATPKQPGGALAAGDRVRLVHGSFNRVVFEVELARTAWLELTFPWSVHWRATLDGEAAESARLNGAYQGVLVPAGRHRVEFRYGSRAASLGMAISCLTLLSLLAASAWFGLRGGTRWLGLAASVGLAGGLFGAWRASLYAGAHLGTEYEFVPPPAEARPNLAFQRPTWMTPVYPNTWNDAQELGRTPDPWGSGIGVDGVRSGGRAFRVSVRPDPHWTVELAGTPEVGEVVVYGGRLGPDPGARLALEVRGPGETEWQRVAETAQLDFDRSAFRFEPRRATSVRLQALGTSGLSAAEVEVFGP